MAETTGISWCDRTWSPWIGCTKVSPACDGCYAAHLMDTRLGRVEWGPHGERRRTSESYWRQLKKWDREADAAGRTISVFPSLCDPWDNAADPGIRREWFALMRETPNLLHLLLSKRPQNAVAMAEAAGGLPENAALGATCENQEIANRNVRHLKEARRWLDPRLIFLSLEPLLGPIDLLQADAIRWYAGGYFDYGGQPGYEPDGVDRYECVDWVITGGETDQGGHKARPTHPAWFRQIRDACAAAGVPYHHKQNGEWMPRGPASLGWPPVEGVPVFKMTETGDDASDLAARGDYPVWMQRAGKRTAGRLLDGRLHDAMPEVAR